MSEGKDETCLLLRQSDSWVCRRVIKESVKSNSILLSHCL